MVRVEAVQQNGFDADLQLADAAIPMGYAAFVVAIGLWPIRANDAASQWPKEWSLIMGQSRSKQLFDTHGYFL